LFVIRLVLHPSLDIGEHQSGVWARDHALRSAL
jgi:hypothetical protein